MQLAFWAALIIASVGKTAANSAASENNAAFAALCRAIRLATIIPKQLQLPAEVESILRTVSAINLTVSDEAFTDRIDVTKAWDTADDDYKNSRKGWDKFHETWVKAKQELSGADKAKYAPWLKHKRSPTAQAQVAQLAQQVFTLHAEIQALKSQLEPTLVNAALNKAVHGHAKTTSTSFQLTFGNKWSDRAKMCSQTSRTSEPKPGSTLLQDAICPRADKGAPDTSAGKACCDDCAETTTAEKQITAGAVDFKAKWNKLTAACSQGAAAPTLNTDSLAQAATTLSVALSHKTGTQTNHDYVLGTIAGTGGSGCGGNKANNEGKCVVYKKGLTTEGDEPVLWLKELHNAVLAEEKRKTAMLTINQKLQTMAALNSTLEKLVLVLDSSVRSSQAAAAAAPATGQRGNDKEALDREAACNEAGNDPKACEKLKGKGCTYDASNKKCTLSEEGKKAAAEKEAKKAANHEEKTDSKCSKNSKNNVFKSPDCK